MYEKITLPNGFRILMEHLPHVRSTSIGIWIYTGSMNEGEAENGISHFLEHMNFKGTSTRSSKEIAQSIDEVGGHLDGMTSREFTCYYVKVMDTHAMLALDILTDMLLNSVFATEEINKERKVVTEEIKMYEDAPDEYIHDVFIQSIWKDHALGRPILGSRENVSSFDEACLRDYARRFYIPENIIISVAGNFDRAEIEKKTREIFERIPPTPRLRVATPPEHTASQRIVHRKELQQVHLCLGSEGLSRVHPQRFSFYIMNTLLGGGMSSRLFQEVREKRGLAYSIYSYPTSYKIAGAFTIYCGTSPENFEQLVEVLLGELKQLKNNRIPDDELARAKEQFKGSLMLSLENTDNRMTRMAKLEMYFNEVPDLDTTIKRINAVTSEAIQEVAREIFADGKIALSAIGPESDNFKSSPVPLTA